MATTLSFLSPILSHRTSLSTQNLLSLRTHYCPTSSSSSSSSLASSAGFQKHGRILPCSISPAISTNATHYDFFDDSPEVELRLELGDEGISPREIYVDATENSLVIRVQHSGYTKTLLDTNSLYGMIKPSETIWYIDDTQLVVNMQKTDPELKWHDIVESWELLTTGVVQLLKGTSIFLVGESMVAKNTPRLSKGRWETAFKAPPLTPPTRLKPQQGRGGRGVSRRASPPPAAEQQASAAAASRSLNRRPRRAFALAGLPSPLLRGSLCEVCGFWSLLCVRVRG